MVLGLAGTVIRTVDPEHALALARRAIELRPHDPGPYSRLIGPLAALEAWDEIATLLNDPPPAFADSPAHVHLRAVELRRKGDLAGAQAAARELVALTPDDAKAWGLLALYLSNEDLRSEADAALYALDLNPLQTDALLVLARSAEARGETVEAARLRELRRENLSLSEATKPIEDVRRLFKAGKRAEVVAAMERFDDLSLSVRGFAFRYRIRLLTTFEDDGALERAVAAYSPDDDHWALGRAEILLRQGRFAEARVLLEPRWNERRPPMLAPFLVRALGGDDPEAARRLADELIAEPPGNVLDAFATLIAMSKSKVMVDRLYPYLKVIERKYPSSQPIREFHANVLLRMGRFSQASRLGGTLDAPPRERFRTKRMRAVSKALLKLVWKRLRFKLGLAKRTSAPP